QINLSYDKPDAKKPLQKDDLYIGGQEEAPTYEYEEFEGGAIHSDEENGSNNDYRPSPVMKIIFVFAATVIAAVVLTLVVTLCFNKKARCR
ncbi:MAG: hypothetical protein II702_04370, partial [Clostridia bacterium]|nr:hypothetical protein [Clostridia bacterium]